MTSSGNRLVHRCAYQGEDRTGWVLDHSQAPHPGDVARFHNHPTAQFLDAVQGVRGLGNSFSIRIHQDSPASWLEKTAEVLHVTSGPALERAGDLAAILTKLEEGDVLQACRRLLADAQRAGAPLHYQTAFAYRFGGVEG
mgnify:CR=1 FL=1